MDFIFGIIHGCQFPNNPTSLLQIKNPMRVSTKETDENPKEM